MTLKWYTGSKIYKKETTANTNLYITSRSSCKNIPNLHLLYKKLSNFDILPLISQRDIVSFNELTDPENYQWERRKTHDVTDKNFEGIDTLSIVLQLNL